MAIGSTLYRVSMEVSDVDRGVYESLAYRVARHPSESDARLVVRILAFALCYEEGLQFGKGLSDGEEPALATRDLTGKLLHWVDVGTPGADRIHAASKRAERVSIVCHRGIDALTREMTRRRVHGAEDIDVLLLEPDFVESLAAALERNSEWTVVCTDGALSVTLAGQSFEGNVQHVPLPQ